MTVLFDSTLLGKSKSIQYAIHRSSKELHSDIERHLLSSFGQKKINIAIFKNVRTLAQLVPPDVCVLAMCYVRHLVRVFGFEEAVYAAFILAEDFAVDKGSTVRFLI